MPDNLASLTTRPLPAVFGFAQPSLRTPRLLLRPFNETDVPGLVRLCSPREIAAMVKTIPHPYSSSDAEDFLARIRGTWERGEMACFAVVETVSQELVASMGLRVDAANLRAEIGYCTAMPCWGRGFATEAGRALLPLAFGEMELIRLVAHVFPHNPASFRVLEKLGFKQEGVLRRHAVKWGTPTDLIALGLLKEEACLDYTTPTA